jgi:hypothetical protein
MKPAAYILAAMCWAGSPGLARAQAPLDLDAVTSHSYRQAAYPDWDAGILREAGVVEEKRREGGIAGVATVRAARDCWISALYYSASGRGYLMLEALLIPVRHDTTATYPLPPGDAGLTRLVVWETRPKAALLAQLVNVPVDPARRVPGLLEELWLPRSRPQAPEIWLDERLRLHPAPQQFMLSRQPYAAATLGLDDVVEARNCAVTFRGITVPGSDVWGSFGQWQIGVGNSVQILVPLPLGSGVRHAELRLQGQQAVVRGQASLELGIEGWRSTEVPLQAGAGEMELVSFDLSHDLQPGLNTLSLRMANPGGNWLLRSLELWVE